jgi:hypothetical protein
MDRVTNPILTILRLIGRAIATVIVVVWAIFDEILFPPIRPLIAWLSGLKLFEMIGALIGRTPPYGVLVLLAVPFVLIEPLKIVALYWIATGLLIRGIILLVVSYILSILTLDRIYHAGRGQLMQIGWFARLMRWVVGLRDRVFVWVKSSAAWRWAAARAVELRGWAKSLVG